MSISWYSYAFDMLKAGMCSRKERSWLPMRESLWCWGWRQATIYGSISISPSVLLVHPSCCLLLGSQQLFCSGHSLTVGAEYLVLLEGSPAPACPWCSLGVFTGCTRVSSIPATCFAFAEAPVSSCWGWAAQSLVWHSVTHGTAGTRGTRMCHSWASPGNKRLCVEKKVYLQCKWDLVGVPGPTPAWWSLGLQRRPQEASQSCLL